MTSQQEDKLPADIAEQATPHGFVGMTPAQFKAWRKQHGFKQKEAAEKLGLKKRMIQYYETGQRNGKTVEIPLYIRLACYAISRGCVDFDGTKDIRSIKNPMKKNREATQPTEISNEALAITLLATTNT